VAHIAVNSTTMKSDKQRHRWLSGRLPKPSTRRLVVLTGARQTGKTTLAHDVYRDLRYLDLDSIEERDAVRTVRTAAWAETVGPAVIDEAQKEPTVFDKVKHAYDHGGIDFSVLLGSSRFLLASGVNESLAGRAFVYNLWPLMASELRQDSSVESPVPPLIDRLLECRTSIDEALTAEPGVLLGEAEELHVAALEHLATWGGMPELLRLEDDERREWLRSYQQTFLERDLADLVRLTDLLPFRSLQELAMLRTGQLLSYSKLARDAGMSASTVRRYLEYLRLSYQVVLLPPYSRNLTSSVVKSPKLIWVDLGLLRRVTAQQGPLTGAMFETLVISEIHKWVDTSARDASLFFYRTRSGLEVDLLIKLPTGLIGIEVKSRDRPAPSDRRGLIALAGALGDAWLGGLVVHRGRGIERLDPEARIWGVPAHRLL